MALFERDYWSRLWIVQEVLNAKDATIYCGSSRLSWSKCLLSHDTFIQHRSEINQQFPVGLRGGEQKQTGSLHQLSYSEVLIHYGPGSLPVVSQDTTLLQLLRTCRRKLCVDPRDKIFGLLGIMPENMQQDFRVDYDRSVKEAYIEVVDVLLSTTHRLDIVCESIHFPLSANAHRLPSWVPDWSHNPKVVGLGLSFGFNASKDTKAIYSFPGGSQNKIKIKAIQLGIVDVHGVPVGTFCKTADFLMAFLHWRAVLLGNALLGPGAGGDRRKEVHDSFCRTLCLGQVPSDWKDHWTSVVYNLFGSMLSSRLPDLPLDKKLEKHLDSKHGVPTEQQREFLHHHISSKMRGRTFCITKKGHVGMVTGFMTTGDEIIVPYGCRTPIVIRREGRHKEYRLIGDVYIDGFMDGLAIEMGTGEDKKLERGWYKLH